MAPASLSAPRALSHSSHLGRATAARSSSLVPDRVPVAVRRPVAGASSVVLAARGRLPVAAAAAARGPGAACADDAPQGPRPFIEEMRAAAMRLHTRDQARDGENERPQEPPVARWQPTVERYLRFLVDNKLVFQTLEAIVARADVPWYAEFRNTGLERTEALEKDLEWFRQQGHTIPEPSAPGITYASFLEERSEKDPQAFVCHFYNVHFAHTAGGRIIGKKIAEKLNLQKDLEFYEFEGNLSQLQQNVRDKLNLAASGWSWEEKDRCLDEMEAAFAGAIDLRRHMFPSSNYVLV